MKPHIFPDKFRHDYIGNGKRCKNAARIIYFHRRLLFFIRRLLNFLSFRTRQLLKKSKEEYRRHQPLLEELKMKSTASPVSQPSAKPLPSSSSSAGKEPRTPLKMIDSLPNEKSKIVMRRFVQMTCAKGIQGMLQELNDIKAITTCGRHLLKKTGFDKNPTKNRYFGKCYYIYEYYSL